MIGVSDPIDEELRTVIAEFVGAFEVVFRYDWPYTADNIGYKEGKNFIEPDEVDEYEDWASRGFFSKNTANLSVL